MPIKIKEREKVREKEVEQKHKNDQANVDLLRQIQEKTTQKQLY